MSSAPQALSSPTATETTTETTIETRQSLPSRGPPTSSPDVMATSVTTSFSRTSGALRPVDRSSPPANIAVVGSGYVDLMCGACLADLGFQVTCADIDAAKIDALERGEIPFHEPGCADLVDRVLTAQRLQFQLDTEHAMADADVVMMCVPTPQGDDGDADLTYLLAAARTIGPYLRPGAVVVNKSTVPVGAAAAVARCLDRDDVEVVPNGDRFAADMRGDVVVDARNLLDPTAVAATGLRYIGVGR